MLKVDGVYLCNHTLPWSLLELVGLLVVRGTVAVGRAGALCLAFLVLCNDVSLTEGTGVISSVVESRVGLALLLVFIS